MSKTAIITGAAGGLGKGIAERLANDGFNIVLQDINEALLLETEKEFKEKGYQAVAYKSDVSKKKEQEELVQFAVTEFGQLDVMVNNAGVDAVTPILEIGEEELSKLFNINVFGTLFGIQAAANQFIKQKVKVKLSTHVVLQDMNLMKYSALTQLQNTLYVPSLKQLLKN
ncbi:KR domain protein [Staphylococcus epidermidis VCU123]|nr:KR domain protein [Staphylococcus epidermidis VCU123]